MPAETYLQRVKYCEEILENETSVMDNSQHSKDPSQTKKWKQNNEHLDCESKKIGKEQLTEAEVVPQS